MHFQNYKGGNGQGELASGVLWVGVGGGGGGGGGGVFDVQKTTNGAGQF